MARNENQGPSDGITPHLTIQGGKAHEAIDFYARAFGAEPAMDPMLAEDGKRIMHAHLLLNGGHLMLNDDFPEYGGAATPPGSMTLHLQVADADASWGRALEAGAVEKFPLADQFWGDRYGQVIDPYGFTWSIGAPLAAPQD